ncbi:MAG: hypothetical protein WC562_08555 [Dehalococcoidia bacterium]
MANDDMQKMMAEASDPEIYREVVVFTMGRVIIVLFMVLTVFFLAMFISQITEGPVGDKPAPDWFFLMMSLFFILMTFVIVNFSKLVIKATSRSLTVAYGLFKRVIPWEDIAECYPDEVSALGNYGGYGIRIGRVNGRTRLVYNVLGGERVVLVLKKGRFNEFVFSTNDPDAVMGVIKGRIRR